MLFNSGIFLKVFLPCVVLLALLIQKYCQRALPWLLITASLFFYGCWSLQFLLVFVCLGVVNLIFGRVIYSKGSSVLLGLGIACNLAILGYFKYFSWIYNALVADAASKFSSADFILPLAISFYTFEQISYLIDCHKKIITPASVRDYLFFAMFFPKLIAGPIVRFAELGKQISSACVTAENFAIGMSLFVIGLMKKLLFADQAAHFVAPVFAAAQLGQVPTFADAWLASLAYSFQIYFDFSGYSDMAIGLALIFNIRLPINFYSPYKSTDIIEFWRRWHMTLSRFLRDYLYFPLGGSRKGRARQCANVIMVMAIGGLWHGAGLTFIVWGLLHGLYLAINHVWRHIFSVPIPAWASWTVTFLAVVVAWVFFRAQDVHTAIVVIEGMLGQGGAGAIMYGYALIAALFVVALFCPNSNQLIGLDRLRPDSTTDMLIPTTARQSRLRWAPDPLWAVALGTLLALQMLMTSNPSPFLYFQF